jgi:peptidoglycan/LPS O-acetylase OafA/YrhL
VAGRQSPHSYFSIAPRAGAIPALDGLRGIAILLVVIRHGVRPVWEETGSLFPVGQWDLAAPLLNGWMGVDLFFVLSGFLVSHHLLNRWPGQWSPGFFGRYWLKRVLRTFPAFYATLAVVALGLLPFYQPVTADPVREVLLHLVFLQDYTGSDYVAAFWSLGVEEKFYLLCPLALAALAALPQGRRLRVLAGLALLPVLLRAISLAAQSPTLEGYGEFFWSVRSPFHLAMDGLWIGVACALIHRWRPDWSRHPRLPGQLLAAGLLLLALLMLPVAWFDNGWWKSAVVVVNGVAVAFGLVVLASVLGPHPLSGFLASRWLRFFGVMAYSLYLVHLVMLPVALELVAALPGYAGAAPLVQAAVLLPVLLLVSLGAALVLHLAVEKPFLILKDRVRL